MKYQILLPDLEKDLGVVENMDLNGVSFEDDKLIVEKQNGERFLFQAHFDEKNQLTGFATAFGYYRVQALRGGKEAQAGSQGTGKQVIKSSMPGKILKVLCATGDSIEKGQPVLIIEAMKMENEIKSNIAAKVKNISVQEGSRVETGALLIEFE